MNNKLHKRTVEPHLSAISSLRPNELVRLIPIGPLGSLPDTTPLKFAWNFNMYSHISGRGDSSFLSTVFVVVLKLLKSMLACYMVEILQERLKQ